MAEYALTLGRWEELPLYMAVLNSGREFQRQQGFFQWCDGFPKQEMLEEDLRSQKGYALRVDGQVAGYLYLGFDGDSSYPDIVGAWRYDEKYGVIHRIAIAESYRQQGLSAVAFRLAEEICLQNGVRVLRIDTHEDNKRMRHILQKNGFAYCGTVIQNNGLRLAFDKKFG